VYGTVDVVGELLDIIHTEIVRDRAGR
jgi:hypothetical protein